jgi:hypothetical protein
MEAWTVGKSCGKADRGSPQDFGATARREEHGKTVLERLALTDPGKLAQIAYGLLPRDVFISVEQRAPGNLEPDEWAALRRVLDIIEACAPEGAEPAQLFETIETALLAEYAKQTGR